ncbi:cytochrome P450, partial [Bacillus sp. SIMBA_069]
NFIDERVYPKLREDPSLIPGAAEEVLRYRFTASMDRTVTEDTDIFGPLMKKGDNIIAWISSANRDEGHFTNADQFDITRKNSRDHL